MSYRRMLAALILLGLIASGRSRAQTSDPCLDRTVIASVIDRNGDPVLHLEANNFRGQIGGKDVQVVSVERVDLPRRIVILLDTSGSMMDSLPVARAVVMDVLSSAPVQSQVALLTFSDKVTVRSDFSASRGQLASQLQGLTPKGKTALNDALVEGLGLLASPGPDDLLFLITDGGNNTGKTTDYQLGHALRTANVRILAFVFSEESPLPEEVSFGPAMSDLVHRTGGAVVRYFGDRSGEARAIALQKSVNLLLAQAAYAYQLQIKLLAPLEKARKWNLRMVDVPKEIKGVKVNYPPELTPCSAPLRNP